MTDTYTIPVKVLSETRKSTRVEIEESETSEMIEVYLPKSETKVKRSEGTAQVPEWLLRNEAEEHNALFSARNQDGDMMIIGPGGVM